LFRAVRRSVTLSLSPPGQKVTPLTIRPPKAPACLRHDRTPVSWCPLQTLSGSLTHILPVVIVRGVRATKIPPWLFFSTLFTFVRSPPRPPSIPLFIINSVFFVCPAPLIRSSLLLSPPLLSQLACFFASSGSPVLPLLRYFFFFRISFFLAFSFFPCALSFAVPSPNLFPCALWSLFSITGLGPVLFAPPCGNSLSSLGMECSDVIVFLWILQPDSRRSC